MAVTNSGMTLYQNMDTDTNWVGEDGISTEEFQQGSAAQQWIVGKNGNETATLTLADDMSGAKYIIIPMISTISPFYTAIAVTLSDGTLTEVFTIANQLGGLLHRAVAGQWEFNSHCLQFDGTINLANFASVAINVDNGASGNIRSVLNHYIDAIYFGSGRIISGTTVGDKLFAESNDVDISSDKFDGCTLEFSGGIDAQTDIEVATTTGNSYGETLTFREVPNTDNIYTLSITGTADFQATSISSANANVTTNFTSSAATLAPMLGGTIVGAGTTVFRAGETIDGVVFTDRTSITQNGALFENNTINTSGAITVISGGTCTNNTVNKPTSTGIITADLSLIPKNTINSAGTGHAVELTSIGAGTMTWDCVTTGYDAGSAASPVTPTSTGDEDIYVNVASGTLTITVATGATVPSIRSAGAIVNVVAGLVDLKFTLSPSITGYEYAVYSVTAIGSLAGAVELQHQEVATQDNQTYSYTYSAGVVYAVQIIALDADKEEEIRYYPAQPTDQDVTINLTKDTNN